MKMNVSVKLKSSWLLILSSMIILTYSCQNNAASLKRQSSSYSINASSDNHSDSIVKYVKGPALPGAVCCKGNPSRSRFLTIKSK
jgi:hypothetical protein